MMPNYEIEVKYYLQDLQKVENQLRSIHGELVHPRVHEYNLRFDTPDHILTQQRRVLRLRKDQQVRLTYKDPALIDQPVSVRREIEFEVSSFEHARELLLALGYTDITIYEKYRTTYRLEGSIIALDELPFGNFMEIESSSPDDIQKISTQLGLIWERRCNDSYMVLFQTVKERKNMQAQDLTFELFQNQTVRPEDIDLKPADAED